MRDALVIALIIVGTLALPVVGRLWRAGRMSDRTAAVVIVSWAPALVLIYGVIQQNDPLIVALGAGILGLVGGTLYRPVRDLVRGQAGH